MSMTDRERAARAIGFLEGISSVLWSIDGKDGIAFCPEIADFYDQQVETLRNEIFGDKEVSE